MTLQMTAMCSLGPIVPDSIGLSALAIALYILLYIAVWQIVIQSLITALLLKFRKSEHLPAVVSFAISAGVLLFVIGLLIRVLNIPQNTVFIVFIIGAPTFFMAPWVGAMLIMRLKSSFRTVANHAISALFLILILGWVWALFMDERVEEFFGEGTVLAELAYDYVRVPGYDDPYIIRDPEIWQLTGIQKNGYSYCVHVRSHGWMRLPTHGSRNEWTDCFPTVLNHAIFTPGATDDSDRLDDRSFCVRGTFFKCWTDIQGLEWQNGALTLTLDPYFPLTGLVLEFIEDEDIILTLFPSDAATDSEAGTLTWSVPEQPWQDGDSLTFRIRAERLPGDPAGP